MTTTPARIMFSLIFGGIVIGVISALTLYFYFTRGPEHLESLIMDSPIFFFLILPAGGLGFSVSVIEARKLIKDLIEEIYRLEAERR